MIAKWESKSGKHYVNLIKYGEGYGYTSSDGGGYFGNLSCNEEAIALMQAKVDNGYFQPDANKTPMHRVV